MAVMPVLIFCHTGAIRFVEIALATGFLYGVRLPSTAYAPVYFADQDWRNPNRAAYMAALAEHRPHMATVLDWEKEEQLSEVLNWAEEAAQYVQQVLIVPKVVDGIRRLPRRINSKDVVLAYSVPTRFGGTDVPLWEFAGWPVHLLGGSPHRQMQAWAHLSPIADVVSVDGNYVAKLAINWCRFWVPGTARYSDNRWQPTLEQAEGRPWGEDAPYEAFRRSCENVMTEWRQLCGVKS